MWNNTRCDTLWAGCPIVTMPLERMASRVCASLCAAAGFGPQMIVHSQQEYEHRAVMLGTHRPLLADLRARLQAARMSCALFDTHAWVKVRATKSKISKNQSYRDVCYPGEGLVGLIYICKQIGVHPATHLSNHGIVFDTQAWVKVRATKSKK